MKSRFLIPRRSVGSLFGIWIAHQLTHQAAVIQGRDLRIASRESTNLDARKPACLWERIWERNSFLTALNGAGWVSAMLHDLTIACQTRSIRALFVGLVLPSVALGAIHWPASC